MKFSKRLTIFFVLAVIGYQLSAAGAQTPAQVIITWQAGNFYPADFSGKALVTPNTPLTISAEVLRNGKLADLSAATLSWYVDEKLRGRGEGLKEISFTIGKSAGDSHFVRVSIQSGDDIFESSVRIPVSKPVVVLEAPYPNRLVKTGGKVGITAVPYFFNVSAFQDLNFFWQVDSGETKESGTDNRLLLNIGQVPAGQIIQIAGTARNANDVLESATSRIRLITY